MEFFRSMLDWWNLVFALPLAAAAGFQLMQALGLAHMGHGLDHDIDHDVGMDHDHDLSHDTEHDQDHDTDHGQSTMLKVLSIVGIGKVPLMLILTSFSLIFGFTGILSNKVLSTMLFPPVIYFWISLFTAFMAATFLTGGMARVMNKIMPSTETYATTSDQLIGRIGEALYDFKGQSGFARVRDRYGNLQDITCLVQDNSAIKAGQEILLCDFDSGVYFVKSNPLAVGDSSQDQNNQQVLKN